MEVWCTTYFDHQREGYCSFYLVFCGVFYRIVRRRLHFEVRIRFSLSNSDRWNSWDLFSVRVSLCGCRSGSFDLWSSSLELIAPRVLWWLSTTIFFLTQTRRSSPYSLIEGGKLYNGIARDSINCKQNLFKTSRTKILCSQLWKLTILLWCDILHPLV
jgi:hypothetical protein